MNIFITGAYGFVGNNLSKALKTPFKQQLIGIDINELENHIFNEFYSWNELGKVNWNKIDVIIHLAGKAHDTKNTSEGQSYYDI